MRYLASMSKIFLMTGQLVRCFCPVPLFENFLAVRLHRRARLLSRAIPSISLESIASILLLDVDVACMSV